MIDNYYKDEFGVIHQKDYELFTYDAKYSVDRYDSIKDSVEAMSLLRLGFIINTLKWGPISILDVGYGNGSFISMCSKIFRRCYCNDVSDYPVPEGVEFIEDITSKHFEVITFFDSLEHMEDIDIIGRLKCDYVIVSVPYCSYKSDEWFEKWKHRRPNEHLHHFNIESIINFFDYYNFKLINSGFVEDAIRKSDEEHNILTVAFKKEDS